MNNQQTTETTLDLITLQGANELAQQLSSDALATWSDDRRKDFVATFKERIAAARYILVKTAECLQEIALKRHFISSKHTNESGYDFWTIKGGYSRTGPTVGGRSVQELNAIAVERANEVAKQLPKMSTAVRVISPEAAGWIDRRETLVAKGNELLTAAEEVAGPLDLEMLPGTTTLASIRKMGEEREAKRVSLKNQLDKLGKEGQELDSKIDKFLYDGLPGLSDAVMKLVTTYVDKSIAFEAMQRRVEEQVMFGDSTAALELLRTFETDEQQVSDEVKVQFNEALAKLKLIGVKGRTKAQSKLLKNNGK